MDEAMRAEEAGQETTWRLRPVILALLFAISAVAIQQLLDRDYRCCGEVPPLPEWRIALGTGIGVATLAFGFALERVRASWSVIFAIAIGIVAGLIHFWSGGRSTWNWFGDWRYASLFLSAFIALPLFQTARDHGTRYFPYAEVHGHAWTNVVLWCACWAFTGVVFLLAWLLAALFDLIGLHLLHQLLEKHWFAAALSGAAFGGALGLLRERDRVVRLLQRVVTAVLAVLAPVLAIGLVAFLVALPFTGLGALWEATKSTTPILLGCVVGALILCNAVIGNGAEEELANPALRWSGIALAGVLLPLCAIAAVATGLRIDQYGYTSDRLWALTFIVLASGYALAYAISLVLGRAGWAARIRRANLRLAFVVSGIALFLATPILSFNALSARDQVSRLESGRVAIDRFDWAALAFDFGDAGRDALKRLTVSRNAAIAARAKDVAAKNNRWEVELHNRDAAEADALIQRLRVVPIAVPVPQALREKIANSNGCENIPQNAACYLLYSTGASEAFALNEACVKAWIEKATPDVTPPPFATICGATHYRLAGNVWQTVSANEQIRFTAGQQAALKTGIAAGKVEVRSVPSRRLFVGGVPVGDPFE